ncbi:hypothetical protein EDB87DRAFT_1560600 [Lactarius vividus]|nr:hypothetical protein EDB87DRAFT_1560600 [Lactarius vividus]
MEEEKELTTRQAALVDSAFEEGHYESGIAMLEQLCSPTDYPSKSHIRQLLYIALYPPPSSRTLAPNHKASQESPSKISSRHAYSTLLPSPAASELAKRTLRVLADVNSPASLLRALPTYPDPTDGNTASLADPELPSDADSFVALEAVRFRDCKNCWNILKSGFIKSLSETTSSFPGSPRKRRRGEAPVKYGYVDEEESSLIVGENAWPVLEWLLFLFEKDETSTEASRKVRYSPLLLAQIPPTRSDAGSKWDANDPLEIVFYCFRQQDESRRAMGSRLLSLLINLTSTNFFDLPLFMNLLIPRLPSGVEEMHDLLSAMSSTSTLCKFKVTMCQRYLTRSRAGNSRGRGRPRAQPRPLNSMVKQGSVASVRSDSKSNLSRHTLPPASELLHLLTMKADTDVLSKTIKYDLLVTYGIMQHQAPVEDKSQDWVEMLQSGRVTEAVEEAFGGSKDTDALQRILLGMITTWQ